MTHYAPMVNSPATYLAAGINNLVTTVPVLDSSKLPAAPNLATIGTGETAETILYTGRSGNDLTGVTRGFQGTARAWNQGIQVARYLTAYDISRLQEAVAGMDGHVALTNAHSATPTPTASRIMMWDAAMRAKVAAPAAADDIARLDTVTTQVAVVRYVSFNNQNASYTLVLADDAKLIGLDSASAITLTVPTNASVPFPLGTQILVRQIGAGRVTISPASGVTLATALSENKTRAQGSVAGLIKVGTNVWSVFGDLVQ